MDDGVSSISSHQTTPPELSFFCRLSYCPMLMFLLRVFLLFTFLFTRRLPANKALLSAPIVYSDRTIYKSRIWRTWEMMLLFPFLPAPSMMFFPGPAFML